MDEGGRSFRFDFGSHTRQSLDEQNMFPVLAYEECLPPPISEEVFKSTDEENNREFTTEQVVFKGGFTLLKGRISTSDVFGLLETDLVPGKYEGGLKLWECTIDLVNVLRQEIKDGQLFFNGKHVLEACKTCSFVMSPDWVRPWLTRDSCMLEGWFLTTQNVLDAGSVGIQGASVVHFQDFNAEVLKKLTIPNVEANMEYAESRVKSVPVPNFTRIVTDVHYYAGDWAEVHKVLRSVVVPNVDEVNCRDMKLNLRNELSHDRFGRDHGFCGSDFHCKTGQLLQSTRLSPGCRACEHGSVGSTPEGGYDIILMSETVYCLLSLPKLYTLVKKCLKPPSGVLYVAGKKHYFGVGGGTGHFRSLVEDDGVLRARLMTDIADGSSNVREIWKFSFK